LSKNTYESYTYLGPTPFQRPSVKDEKEKETFIKDFNLWEEQYGHFVLSLSSRDKVYGDLQRTRSLILHALPDMFRCL